MVAVLVILNHLLLALLRRWNPGLSLPQQIRGRLWLLPGACRLALTLESAVEFD